MNKLIIVINILLTFLLVGCTDLGVYIEEKKGGKYIKKLEMKDCINIPQLLLICYQVYNRFVIAGFSGTILTSSDNGISLDNKTSGTSKIFFNVTHNE